MCRQAWVFLLNLAAVSADPTLRCPPQVVPADFSVSCKMHCKEQGYASGQMNGKGNAACGDKGVDEPDHDDAEHCSCRCRHIIELWDECTVDVRNAHIDPILREVEFDEKKFCFFDICSVGNPWNKDILRQHNDSYTI
eukprot:gnl/TRDRNA2_/TRDRNA2_59701_c0_seq1.p2 gnl/TRDRNA2_/TRDRNA2_59701_c0~~gnl/TRDRNA2_/TRDRNA2_59701_c0_seq1.p2  ORF type:complete len:138 (-),score=21.42 gnl/TRDRNA2_/TRDRNA2_59701_c0_seq1:97-510(-)